MIPRGGGFETNHGANEATFVLVLLVCALIDTVSPTLGSLRRFLLLRVVCVWGGGGGLVWVWRVFCGFLGGFVFLDVCLGFFFCVVV